MRFRSQTHWMAIAVVVFATLAAYHNTFSSPLVFDDASSIKYNPSIRTLWPLSTVFFPPSECTVAGRPLANLTFALNYAWSGLDVRSYHVVNFCLHVGSALLLFGVIRRTLRRLATSGGDDGEGQIRTIAEAAEPIAVMAAVTWAVHPVLISAVTYISQRTEVLMSFFYLGTVYAFIRGIEKPSGLWLAASVAACFLGVASKEGMMTAPVMVFLYDRTFVAGTFRDAWRSRWRYYLSLAASWLLLALLMSGLKDRAVGYNLGVTPWTYALTEAKAVLLYLRLIVWPFPLVLDYGIIFVERLAAAWPYVLGLGVILAATVIGLFRRPRATFPLAAFFLLLSPTSSVVPIATQPIAENRLYLPAAAMIALGVVGIRRLGVVRSWLVCGMCAVALLALSVQRNGLFQDRLTLWTDNLTKRPENPRSHALVGEMLHEAGRLQEAKARFETALRLNPNYTEAHNNLGTTLFDLGDSAGAIRHLEAAVRLKPEYAIAHNNLGNILLRVGQIERARVHCEEALRIFGEPHRLKPDLAEAHNNLGNVLLFQGNLADAEKEYREAVRLKPEFLQPQMNLGVVLRLRGAFDESLRYLEAVLKAKPDFSEAQFNLGVLLHQIGKTKEAIASFQGALRTRPSFVEVYTNLATIFKEHGDYSTAKAYLTEALRLRPGDPEARAAMAEIEAAISVGSKTATPK